MSDDNPIRQGALKPWSAMNIDERLHEIARRYATPNGEITVSNFEKAVREWLATGEKQT